MKLPALLAAAALAFGITSASAADPVPADTKCYELRTYHAAPGKMAALQTRFRDHTLKLFEKHGITSLGYWVQLDESGAENGKLSFLVSYPSRAAREESWKNFLADPAWQKAAAESEANGKLVEKAENPFLTATDYSPEIKASAGSEPRSFELRTYTCSAGNLKNLDARFREHTMKLFSKHGMTHIAYWHLDKDQPGAADTLVYILAHKSPQAQQDSFKAFRSDPEWIAARDASEKAAGGSLTVKDGVKSIVLKATDFSPTR